MYELKKDIIHRVPRQGDRKKASPHTANRRLFLKSKDQEKSLRKEKIGVYGNKNKNHLSPWFSFITWDFVE